MLGISFISLCWIFLYILRKNEGECRVGNCRVFILYHKTNSQSRNRTTSFRLHYFPFSCIAVEMRINKHVVQCISPSSGYACRYVKCCLQTSCFQVLIYKINNMIVWNWWILIAIPFIQILFPSVLRFSMSSQWAAEPKSCSLIQHSAEEKGMWSDELCICSLNRHVVWRRLYSLPFWSESRQRIC